MCVEAAEAAGQRLSAFTRMQPLQPPHGSADTSRHRHQQDGSTVSLLEVRPRLQAGVLTNLTVKGLELSLEGSACQCFASKLDCTAK